MSGGRPAPILMQALCSLAQERGLDVIACHDCFSPQQLRHLIIPSLRLAFVTVGGVCPAPRRVSRTIHAKRFTNMDGIRARRNRLRFNRKSCRELLAQACEMLCESAVHHDEQERVYTRCDGYAGTRCKNASSDGAGARLCSRHAVKAVDFRNLMSTL